MLLSHERIAPGKPIPYTHGPGGGYPMTASPELLIAISAVNGAFWSLFFQLVPGVTPWFEAKTSQVKQLIMLGVLALATAAIIVASCYIPTLPAVITCDDVGITAALVAFVFSVIGNQSTHSMVKHALPTTGVPTP